MFQAFISLKGEIFRILANCPMFECDFIKYELDEEVKKYQMMIGDKLYDRGQAEMKDYIDELVYNYSKIVEDKV